MGSSTAIAAERDWGVVISGRAEGSVSMILCRELTSGAVLFYNYGRFVR